MLRGAPRQLQQDNSYGNRNSAATLRAANPALQTDLAQLVETIAQATSVIQAAGLNTAGLNTGIVFHLSLATSLTVTVTSHYATRPTPQTVQPID